MEILRKKDLIEKVTEKIPDEFCVDEVIGAFIDTVAEEIAKGNRVQLQFFGTFKLVDRAERKVRNPQTGEEMKIPAHKLPVFSPSKSFKSAVN